MTYLLDTDVLIDGINGREEVAVWLQQRVMTRMCVSIISVSELYSGAFRMQNPSRHLDAIRQYLGAFTILGVSDPVAEIFAREKAELQRQGRHIGEFDLLIAATALHHGLVTVTRNVRHCQRVRGLALESP